MDTRKQVTGKDGISCTVFQTSLVSASGKQIRMCACAR